MDMIITGINVLDKYSTQTVSNFCLLAHEDLGDITIEKIDSNLRKIFNSEPLDGDLTAEQVRLLELIASRMQVGINDAHAYMYQYIKASVASGSDIFKTLVLKIAMAEISLSGWATLNDISEVNSLIIIDRNEAIDMIKALGKNSYPDDTNPQLIGDGVQVTKIWS